MKSYALVASTCCTGDKHKNDLSKSESILEIQMWSWKRHVFFFRKMLLTSEIINNKQIEIIIAFKLIRYFKCIKHQELC